MGLRWFVVESRAQCEKLAALHLRRQHFEVWIPLIWGRRWEHGRWHAVPIAAFAKYLFVHVDLDNDRWRSINGTRGVKNILQLTEGRPSPVPDRVIDDLRRRLGDEPMDEREVNEVMQEFLEGDRVRIEEGPFADFPAVVKWTAKDRACVVVAIFGRGTETEVGVAALRKIEE